MTEASRIDVLILTAADGEPEGVLAVTDGRLGDWRPETAPGWTGKIWRGEFQTASGAVLTVAVARTLDQGPQSASHACGVLNAYYHPRCLAMAGVCAGRPGSTHLGDVVLAERLYRYDQGAQVATKDGGSYTEHDVVTYRVAPDWLVAARELRDAFAAEIAAGTIPEWMAARPVSLDWQQWWVLDCLDRGEDPTKHAEVKRLLPNRLALLQALQVKKLIRLGPPTLTATGRKALAEARDLYGDALLVEPNWRLHVEPMGTGEKLVRDPKVWDLLIHLERHTAALEMEGAALGYASWAQNVSRCLVVKGVMDNGDTRKNNACRAFAARAAGEVLLRFLRENLAPAAPPASVPVAPAPAVAAATVPGRAATHLLRPGIDPLPDLPLPSHLLTARYQAIGFQRDLRGETWAQLLTWVNGERTVGLRLLTGPGGAGKTRLFQELAAHLRAGGEWDAGFLHDGEDPEALEALVRNERPTLVILDYAEAHRLRDSLLREVVKILPTRTAPLRLVLLARNSGDWWSALQSGSWDGLLDAAPQELPEVKLEGEARTRFFLHARTDLARILHAEPDAEPPDLTHERFGRPLYLVLAALAQLQNLPTGADTLLTHVLGHESRAWKKRWPQAELRDLRVFMAAVTLLGGLPTVEAAEELAARLNISPDVLDFCELYPGREFDNRQEYLAPLEPDLLGETLVAQVLTDKRTRVGYLSRVFDGTSSEAVTHGLTVFGRLEMRHQHDEKKVAEWYRRVLTADLAHRALPAVQAALALGREGVSFTLGRMLSAALEEAGTVELAELIAGHIPLENITLQDTAAWSYRRLLEAEEMPPTLRAARLRSLASHLSKTGQWEAALAASDEAVSLFRQLVELRPDEFLPKLAAALSNLGVHHSELGQYDAAVTVTREAVAIRRRLVVDQSGSHLPGLAMSLSNLGGDLAAMGREVEALDATREATQIRRRLASMQPEVFSRVLGQSLHNLANRFAEAGQSEASLATSREAAELFRRLAATQPEVFLPDLANALSSLGLDLHNARHREEALAVANEATTLYRKLAAAQPRAFRFELGQALHNLSIVQVGQSTYYAIEALGIFTEHIRRNRTRFEEPFRICLGHAVKCLQTADLDPDADPVVVEAREVGRELGFWE